MGLMAWRNKIMGGGKVAPAATTPPAARPGGQSPIAVDFGTGCLKVLQINAAQTGHALVAAAALETPEDLLNDPAKRLQFQADALPKLVKAAGFKGKRAVCAIPASLSFCKHMKVEKTQGLTSAAIVEAALVQQFGCHPAQMVFRHYEVADVPRSGGGLQTEVICLAATRELVTRLMGTLSAAKLDPVGMHCEQLALLRAFDPIARRTEDKLACTLYLDIGAGSTNMLIAHGQQLVFTKRVEMGGRFLDEAICKQTKCELDEARKLRRELNGVVLAPKPAPREHAMAGSPERPLLTPEGSIPISGTLQAAIAKADAIADAASSTLAAHAPGERRHPASAVYSADVTAEAPRGFIPPKADLTEALEIMTDDIAVALRYYQSLFPQKPIDRVIFVGGEARYKGLCQHIAKALRLSAQIADPLASIARSGNEPTPGVDLKVPQPGWVIPLGLALLPTDL